MQQDCSIKKHFLHIFELPDDTFAIKKHFLHIFELPDDTFAVPF